MTEIETRAAYASELLADVLATAESEGRSAVECMTDRYLNELEAAGAVDVATSAYFSARGVEIHGWGTDDIRGTLDLFTTVFRQRPLQQKLVKADVTGLLKRLTAFVGSVRAGVRDGIEPASEAHDMALGVEKALTEVRRVRLFVLTNCLTTVSSLPPTEADGLEFTTEIWDLRRLHRLALSGVAVEPIVADFDPPIPCLTTPTTDSDYSVLLGILHGPMLAEVYARYGARLLELNVRSFLQAKGAVNRGIRDTLLHHGERFLAYNNGVSATASRVDVETTLAGPAIRRIHDLQIVNGGQTTASIHSAFTKDKASLADVYVQMKLTVVDTAKRDEIVPEISRYANTQNKVNLVDFSANHPFHVSVQQVTRTLYADDPSGGGSQTLWFYERARGQYADELAKAGSTAAQRRFKILHPVAQKFTKADLAKYENTWAQKPHLVSRGAEKNFRQFMLDLSKDATADRAYCTHLIAKAILFKATEKIVGAHAFGGYRANIVTYTLARLALATDGRLDLDSIWRDQRPSPALAAALDELCIPVRDAIVNPPPGRTNVGEWSKLVDCWSRVARIDWSVPAPLAVELIDPDAGTHAVRSDTDVEVATAVPDYVWRALAVWAKESGHLEPGQRGVAGTLAKSRSRGYDINARQATVGLRALDEARRLGFREPERLSR